MIADGHHVVVLVDAVRDEAERREYERLLDGLRADGAAFSVIVWDRGRSVLDLDALGPVADVEDLNRWRLPIALAKVAPLRPLARALRHARMRRWWHRAGSPASVLVLGTIRPELRHYLPPGLPVGVVVGAREPRGAESWTATLAVADLVVALDEASATRCRSLDPTVPVVTVPQLGPRWWWRVAARSAPPLPPLPDPAGAALVVGLGPVDWDGGADLFLATLARLPAAVGGRTVVGAWLGELPAGPSGFPYRFDAERLGLADRLHWLGDRADWSEVVRRADAVVVTARRPPPLAFDPIVDSFTDDPARLGLPYDARRHPLAALAALLEVPVVRLDVAGADEATQAVGAAAPYPDTQGLADLLHERLAAPPRRQVDDAVAGLLGVGTGGRP